MTQAFPYHEDCYTWPRIGVFTRNTATDDLQAAELNVHCLCHVGRRQFYCVGFIGVDRKEQIGQVAKLAETMGAEVKVIKGIGFTDEIINGLMAAMVEPEPDECPGQLCCCLPVDWPNKIQRRVLRKAMDMTTRGGEFHEEKLAKRLHMPVEEVRRHLEVLADIGLMEEAR
jgi:hypothetical protein